MAARIPSCDRYAETLRLTEGRPTSDGPVHPRASVMVLGDLDNAADELAALWRPQGRDPWAREWAGLARRGAGKHRSR